MIEHRNYENPAILIRNYRRTHKLTSSSRKVSSMRSLTFKHLIITVNSYIKIKSYKWFQLSHCGVAHATVTFIPKIYLSCNSLFLKIKICGLNERKLCGSLVVDPPYLPHTHPSTKRIITYCTNVFLRKTTVRTIRIFRRFYNSYNCHD